MNQFFVPNSTNISSKLNTNFSQFGNLYFVSEPNYNMFPEEDLEKYRYVAPNKPANDIAVMLRTSYVVQNLTKRINPVATYIPEDVIKKLKMGIDLSKLTIEEVVEVCDRAIECGEEEIFELLYMNGNIPIDEYIKKSKFPYSKFFRYIKNPIESQIIAKLKDYPEIRKIICARKLKLSVQDTNNLVQIKLLEHDGFPVLSNVYHKLEILFSMGAIALTREQIERINEGHFPEYYPTLKQVLLAIRYNLNITQVTTNPYIQTISQGEVLSSPSKPQTAKQNDWLELKQQLDYAKQQLQDKKEREEKQQQKEAEDEMDKIFAEAQKNIEEGCEK